MVTTNGTHTATEVEGVVSRVNEHGLLLDGRSTWLNISRFAGSIALPAPGQRVRCELDKAGYIRSIEPVDAVAPVDTPERSEPPNGGPMDKDRRITRMAAINAAIALLNAHGAATVEQVLDVAAQFEAWVLR